ncbi:MAG: ectonucleotide pyrophosphatase/phosphodiesterase [Pseudomonadota bacterium]|nr:ectonucleotide pyrophosphatase/phosphodiesterase [Pseudomonadota bacterium]
MARLHLAGALVLLVAACSSLSASPDRPVPTRAVLLVSVDGLRTDALGSGTMPTLDALAAAGVQAEWMNPSYPTLTFPNHYTMVTGLRPDHHGIVNNTILDPVLGRFSLRNRDAVSDPRWWGGKPAWVSLQEHGGRAATMFWPGSEAPIAGQHPSDWLPFDGDVGANERVDQILAWLDREPAQRPRLVTLYFDQVDHEEHAWGPGSPQALTAQAHVDAALARLLDGLEARGIRDRVDLIVVSDHGMAAVPPGQREYINDWLAAKGLPIDAVEVVTRGSSMGVNPADGADAEAVVAAFVGRHAHGECWRKQELPVRWHYGSHARVPAIVCQADIGWLLMERFPNPRTSTHHTGAHGYAPEAPEMRAVFIADGPSFADGAHLPAFDNVDVYPLLMRLLDVPAEPNDGDPDTFDSVLH